MRIISTCISRLMVCHKKVKDYDGLACIIITLEASNRNFQDLETTDPKVTWWKIGSQRIQIWDGGRARWIELELTRGTGGWTRKDVEC